MAVLISLDSSTLLESWLSLHAHPANLHSLCSHFRKSSDTEPPTHVQTANPPQTWRTQIYTPCRLILHVSSKTILFSKYHMCIFYQFLSWKDRAHTILFHEKTDTWQPEKNTLTFKSSGCLSDSMTLRSTPWIPESTSPPPPLPWRWARS